MYFMYVNRKARARQALSARGTFSSASMFTCLDMHGRGHRFDYVSPSNMAVYTFLRIHPAVVSFFFDWLG